MNQQEEFTQIILEKLKSEEDFLVNQWKNPIGTKTKHFYIDNLLPASKCTEIYNSFPRAADGFYSRESFREKKKVAAHLNEYSAILSDITYAIQDKRVVDLISLMINFECIEPDPLLYAGGLSMMFKNDFLNPHIDNSHDASRERYRRLNALYYVTPDWKIENGGNLELWDEDKLQNKTIPYAFNRFVIMETNKESWHSVSKVLVDMPRCCVSNYYFSKISPDSTDYYHVTSFTGRPEEKFKRLLANIDNGVRNFVSSKLKISRGKFHVNQSKADKK